MEERADSNTLSEHVCKVGRNRQEAVRPGRLSHLCDVYFEAIQGLLYPWLEVSQTAVPSAVTALRLQQSPLFTSF